MGIHHVIPGLLLLLITFQAYSDNTMIVGDFSGTQPGQTYPVHWEPFTFEKIPGHTRYTLLKDNGTTVVRADSRNAASGLIHRITIDPRQYPIVQWRWKIINMIEKSDVHSKSGDDYPARLYITFAYEPDRLSLFQKMKYRVARALYGDIPSAAINYIWTRKTPAGSIVDNAFTGFTKMIVIRSGPAQSGQWVVEERNVLQDYLLAFGEQPPLINGVAIMTDTDNTGETATAYYGDIIFKGLNQPE